MEGGVVACAPVLANPGDSAGRRAAGLRLCTRLLLAHVLLASGGGWRECDVESTDGQPGAGLARTPPGKKLWGPEGSAVEACLTLPLPSGPVYGSESKACSADTRRKHIMGQNTAEHMRRPVEEDEDAHRRRFSTQNNRATPT